MTFDELAFFNTKPEELALYEALIKRFDGLGSAYSIKVQKTQISFLNRYMFACVSFARVKRKAELPPHYLVLTFGLNYMKKSARIAVCTEAARNRCTHHVVIGSAEEIDDELMAWIREAYEFSDHK